MAGSSFFPTCPAPAGVCFLVELWESYRNDNHVACGLTIPFLDLTDDYHCNSSKNQQQGCSEWKIRSG